MKDAELRSMIKSGVRQDAGNPYFVRKVLNRLPARPAGIGYAWILWLACGVGVVVMTLLWADYITSFSASDPRPMYFLSLWATTLFLLFTLLRPLFYRR